MRIAASLNVKDEVELISTTIDHLRRIGVDHIIACDLKSTDGTYEVLEQYRSDRDFWLFQATDREPDDFQTWLLATVALIKSVRADWVLFLDADEFWLPASGSLRDCRSLADADALVVDRFHVPVGPGGPTMPRNLTPEHYGEALLIVEPVRDRTTYLAQDRDAAWIYTQAEPKVMVRREKIGSVELGGHDVLPAGGAHLRRLTPDDLIIVHLPFTTRRRFARKVENIRRVIQVHDKFFVEDIAWHWRRWVALADQGLLDEEFDRSVFDAERLAELRRQGVVRSVAQVFESRMKTAASSAAG